MTETAEALLNAHVEHELSQLRADALPGLVREHVGALLRWTAEVKLNQVTSRERVAGIIDRNVIDLTVSGGITELAGEMARVVVTSRQAANAPLEQVLSPESYDEFAAEILSLDRLRNQFVSLVAGSSGLRSVLASVLARAVTELLFRRPTGVLPQGAMRLSELVSMLEARVVPQAEQRLETFLASFLEQHRERFVKEVTRLLSDGLSTQRLRAVADELYNSLAPLQLSEVFAALGEDELEDFVVLCFEFWLSFRKTPYFRQTLLEMVDFFFQKYGEQSLAALIDDMGVSEAMVVNEILTALGPAVQHALDTGFAEQRLRAHLEPFYRSVRVANILQATAGSD